MSVKAKKAAIGAVIALFANMGLNSVFTVFLPSFIAEWPDTGVATIALAATFGCAMASLFATFFVGPLLKKFSPRTMFIVSAVLAVCYCLLYCYAENVIMLIMAGLFGGVVLSIGVHAMGVATITPYFAQYGKKLPTVIGLVLSAAAMGAAVFSFIPGLLIDIIGWRKVFLVIGAIVVICNIIAVLLIPKTEKTGNSSASKADSTEQLPGLTMKQTLKTPAFWLVFFGILFLTIMYQGLCTYMPTFLTTCGLSRSSAGSMQGIMQLVGIVFIFAGGALVNKIGVKGLILFTAAPLATGCLLYAYVFPNVATVWFAVICSILCVTGGVITNICPTITPILFGKKSMNQINSIYSGGAFWGGAALASQVVGRVLTATDSFANSFLTASVIGIVGMLLLFIALSLNPLNTTDK